MLTNPCESCSCERKAPEEGRVPRTNLALLGRTTDPWKRHSRGPLVLRLPTLDAFHEDAKPGDLSLQLPIAILEPPADL